MLLHRSGIALFYSSVYLGKILVIPSGFFIFWKLFESQQMLHIAAWIASDSRLMPASKVLMRLTTNIWFLPNWPLQATWISLLEDTNDEPGQFSISSNEEANMTNLFEAFETFYNNTYTDFGMLSKTDISNAISNWKECITPIHFASIMTDIALRDNRPTNNHCVDSDPFCTSDVITFAAATSSQTADQLEGTTIQDGCIGSSYSPAWYHMRIQTGGQFIIHAEGHDPNNSSTTRDIDFCILGPYSDPTSPCVAQLTTNMIIDCCFSASYSENIYLGYPGGQHNHGSSSHGTITEHTPVAGEYYTILGVL